MALIAVREGNDLLWLGNAEDAIKVGRLRSCAITLNGDSVGRIHAVLEVDGDSLAITDLGSTHGTSVNDVLIRERTWIGPNDRVQIGGRVLTFALDWEPIGQEEMFLAALATNPRDEDTRAVYADWLEEHGEGPRAELLRHGHGDAGEAWWRAIVAPPPMSH